VPNSRIVSETPPPQLPFEPTLPSGSVQAGYRIVRRIGGGGFGTVYEAIDLDLDRQVAFKVLRDRRPHVLDRFRDEARLLARIDDAHVVRVHRYGRLASGHPFLVMELFGDGSLSAAAPYGRALAPEVAVAAIAQVLLGLDAAHRAGIVHRDVKDANVLVDSASGRVKVCDFGISRSMEPLEGEAPATGSGLVGTLQYMAPERFAGVRDDPRSDLFAVGVVFYRLLTGRRPFDAPGGDTLQVIHKITHDDVAPPAEAPAALARVCAKLLAREPSRRYATARAALDDLRHAWGEIPAAVAFPFRPAAPAPVDACASTADGGHGPVLADGDEIDVWGATGSVSSGVATSKRPAPNATAGAVPRKVASPGGPADAPRPVELRGAPAGAPGAVGLRGAPADVQRPAEQRVAPLDAQRPVEPSGAPADARRPAEPRVSPGDAQRPVGRHAAPADVQRPMEPRAEAADGQRSVEPRVVAADGQRPVEPRGAPADAQRPAGRRAEAPRQPLALPPLNLEIAPAHVPPAPPPATRRRRLSASLVAATALLAIAVAWRVVRTGPAPAAEANPVVALAAPPATAVVESPSVGLVPPPASTTVEAPAPVETPAPKPAPVQPRRSAPPPVKRPLRGAPPPTALAAEDAPPPAAQTPAVSLATSETPRRAPSRAPVSPDALRSPFVLPER
jgi:serine/threonine-protein kinase